MSSTANPYGMVPARRLGSVPNSQGFSPYEIADGYATSIFFGDVVKLATTGYVQKDTGTTALTPIGIFLGCEYVDATYGLRHSNYWPASQAIASGTVAKAYILDDPNAEFTIQADETLTIAAIGANAAIVQTAGTSQFGKSRNALDGSTVATTSTLPLRILGLVETPENAWGDAYPDLRVKFNNHQLTTTTGI